MVTKSNFVALATIVLHSGAADDSRVLTVGNLLMVGNLPMLRVSASNQ